MKRYRIINVALLSLALVFVFCVSALAGSYYVGSIHSNKYHYPDCPAAQNIKQENLIFFRSARDAVSAGYVPCKICRPPYLGGNLNLHAAPTGAVADYEKPPSSPFSASNPEAAENLAESNADAAQLKSESQYYHLLQTQLKYQQQVLEEIYNQDSRAGLSSTDPSLPEPTEKAQPLSESELAECLAEIHNFDIKAARAAGYTDATIINYLENEAQ